MSYIRLTDVPELIPFPVCPATISNWHRRGVHGHKLKVRRCGGKVFTTQHWVDEFLGQLNGNGNGHAKANGRKRL